MTVVAVLQDMSIHNLSSVWDLHSDVQSREAVRLALKSL